MLSIEHMVLVKPLFQQNMQLMLNLHMLVSGNTVALLWQLMNGIYGVKTIRLYSFLFYFCFDQ